MSAMPRKNKIKKVVDMHEAGKEIKVNLPVFRHPCVQVACL